MTEAMKVSTVFDLATPRTPASARCPSVFSPDSIIYDPVSHDGMAFDGDANMAVAFDPRTGRVLARMETLRLYPKRRPWTERAGCM